MFHPEYFALPKAGSARHLNTVFSPGLMTALRAEIESDTARPLECIPPTPAAALDKETVIDTLLERGCPATAEVIHALGRLTINKRIGLNRLSGIMPEHTNIETTRTLHTEPHLQFWVIFQGQIRYDFPANHYSGYRYDRSRWVADTGDVICLNNLPYNPAKWPRYGIVSDEFPGNRLVLNFSHNPTS